jgi:hypothetical protein
MWVALCGFRGGGQQSRQKGAEQSFAPTSGVVHELEEGEIAGQLLLRNAPVRSQPRAQQRPNAFQRVDVDLAEPVAIVVTSILAAAMMNGLMVEAPLGQPSLDRVFVGVD